VGGTGPENAGLLVLSPIRAALALRSQEAEKVVNKLVLIFNEL
jgi:hypothetical protein